MSKSFGITGVAGYVAPKHLQAIKDTENNLVAALDPHDSVGILDSFFPEAKFFTEFERFDRHLEKLRRKEQGIDYLTICSPNYLHDAHIRLALRLKANAICEKPIVLNPWNLDALQELEAESGRRVFTILQLRVHPAIQKLREKILAQKNREKHDINLTYITPRGEWYHRSWKGQLEYSGGLATNIGVHFFDMLIWIFGAVERSEVHFSSARTIAGCLELERAIVKWFLSIDGSTLPDEYKWQNPCTYRSLILDGTEFEFSKGFTKLHTVVYQKTLNGEGFGIDDARPSINLIHDIRIADVIGINENSHPFLRA